MKKRNTYTYCIIRLHKEYWRDINHQLKERGYTNMKCYVPTVSIIRKTKAGKKTVEEIPMLFNYGFLRLHTKLAYNRQFLRDLRKEIPGIVSFLMCTETMHPRKKRKRVDTEDFDDFSKVATISKKEYLRYKRLSERNSIYSTRDISKLRVGSMITLKGYPFEGLEAIVEDINIMNKTASLSILLKGESTLNIQLPLDNILYTIYDNYEDPVTQDYNRVDIDNMSDDEQPYEEDTDNIEI